MAVCTCGSSHSPLCFGFRDSDFPAQSQGVWPQQEGPRLPDPQSSAAGDPARAVLGAALLVAAVEVATDAQRRAAAVAPRALNRVGGNYSEERPCQEAVVRNLGAWMSAWERVRAC